MADYCGCLWWFTDLAADNILVGLEPAAEEEDGPQRMMAEVEEGQTEEALQRHRDSVSTLGFTTSSGMSQASHVMEMQGSSRESPPLLLVATSPLVVAPVGALSDASLAAAGLPMATASAVATATLTSNFSVSAVKRMDSDEVWSFCFGMCFFLLCVWTVT